MSAPAAMAAVGRVKEGRGRAEPSQQKKFEGRFIREKSPISNDPNELISTWQYMAGTGRQDYWNMGIGGGEQACFGRAGCRKVWLYLLDNPDDIVGAKEVGCAVLCRPLWRLRR